MKTDKKNDGSYLLFNFICYMVIFSLLLGAQIETKYKDLKRIE
jgi:hypothetical protein